MPSAEHSDPHRDSTQSIELLNEKVKLLQNILKESKKQVRKFHNHKFLYKEVCTCETFEFKAEFGVKLQMHYCWIIQLLPLRRTMS